MALTGVAPGAFARSPRGGGTPQPIDRPLAEEVPVAIETEGLGYAVLMATPDAVEDLVTGFLLAERIVRGGDAIRHLDVIAVPAGIVARVGLDADAADRARGRVRHRTTDSACGLCGIDNLEQALRPLPRVAASCAADDAAVFAALAALSDHQPLNRATGAAHAAALCAPDGAIRLVREDVGRHNAFDKLIGAMARMGLSWDGGFALLSSRCSYELVEKAVLADCPMLATISAPTALAVARAREAGLPLRVLVRSDALLASG